MSKLVTKEINKQIRILTRENNTFKKVFMYKALLSLLQEDPIMIVSYLYNSKIRGEGPITARIFQRFVEICEANLPIEGKYSLLDPELGIFIGETEFNSYATETGFVHNNNAFKFSGKKLTGQAYIGQILEMTDTNGNSLMDRIKYYQFSKIKTDLPKGTEVIVKARMLKPHYAVGTLVSLQRNRDHLHAFVKSIKF